MTNEDATVTLQSAAAAAAATDRHASSMSLSIRRLSVCPDEILQRQVAAGSFAVARCWSRRFILSVNCRFAVETSVVVRRDCRPGAVPAAGSRRPGRAGEAVRAGTAGRSLPIELLDVGSILLCVARRPVASFLGAVHC